MTHCGIMDHFPVYYDVIGDVDITIASCDNITDVDDKVGELDRSPHRPPWYSSRSRPGALAGPNT